VIDFKIKIINRTNRTLSDVIVKDILPQRIYFMGKLAIDGTYTSTTNGNLFSSSGMNLGELEPYETKTITFQTKIARIHEFPYGQTKITNTATASIEGYSDSDSAAICCIKRTAQTAVTYVSTGIGDTLKDSFLIPLLITLLLVWLFKSKIIRFEEWRATVKERYEDYQTNRILKSKIKEIRKKEFSDR